MLIFKQIKQIVDKKIPQLVKKIKALAAFP